MPLGIFDILVCNALEVGSASDFFILILNLVAAVCKHFCYGSYMLPVDDW
jgi:hypothetical protein